MKVIKKISKKELKEFLYEIDRTDKNLYEEMNSNNGFGVFQFSGNTALGLVKSIHPDSFEELIAINALARPGTIGFADSYKDGKNNGTEKYPKAISDLLRETKTICLYQEQIMSIFNKVGGFTLEKTNFIRGLMKKLGKANKKKEDLDKWDEQVKIFTKNALEKGLTEKQAKDVSNDLLSLSAYSFNKCFSGNSIIDRDNWKNNPLTIREMFLTKNNSKWAKENGHKSLRDKYIRNGYGKCYSLNNDGRLRLNNIVDIYFSGVRKTFKITTESGKYLTVTSNHKFPTEDGYKTIETGLKVGDKLYVNGGYEITKIDYSFSGIKTIDRKFKNYEGEGFKSGEKNSAFIDGSFVKFNIIKKQLKEEFNNCMLCHKETDRLECHHVDRNRKNNKKSNLILLCPSCHKRMDYKAGRSKKGSKGLLTLLEKIILIEEMPEEDVYDVEMESPFHTLSVNKIIASNSHAMAYTYVALQTLFLSKYFRKYFYAATLAYEATKKDAIKEAYENCSRFDFEILPPNINTSSKNFKPLDGDRIIFGLNEIKNVGEKPMEAILSNRPYTSVIDFILKTYDKGVNKSVVSSLVCAGCFDEFINSERKHYEKIIEKFYEIKKTTKIKELIQQKWEQAIEETPYVKTTNEDFVLYEKELLGHNFFHGNFSNEEREKIDLLYSKGYIDKSLKDVKESKATSRIPVYVSKFRTHIDKNKNEMAFVEIEDMNGERANFPIFASYWKFIKEKFLGEGLYIFSLYKNQDNQIMFGSKNWIKDESKSKLIYGFKNKEVVAK